MQDCPTCGQRRQLGRGSVTTHSTSRWRASPGRGGRENEAYGDLMSYEAYYWGSRKHVTWDAWEDRVSFVNLGDFEGNSGP